MIDPRLVPRAINGSWRENATDDALVLEAWGQGCMFGALMIMACVTVANMRKGVLLHKLILLEVGQDHRSFHTLDSLPTSLVITRDYARYLLLHGF